MKLTLHRRSNGCSSTERFALSLSRNPVRVLSRNPVREVTRVGIIAAALVFGAVHGGTAHAQVVGDAVPGFSPESALGTQTTIAPRFRAEVKRVSPSRVGDESQSISVRKPSLGPPSDPVRSPAFDPSSQRDQLFAELADEFSMFDRLGRLVRRVSHLVKPSVIHIEAHKTEVKDGQRESFDEAGSGIVIRAGGDTWVLTNRHVILGSKTNEIVLRTSDGRDFQPIRILDDPNTDVAVMQVKLPGLLPARVGDSGETQIGDFVIAIGSPFGLSHSVTFGILSAKGRRDLSLGEQRIDLQDFFQTDAAINPGNSGGPLLNLKGEVIALNTAIASSSGGSEGIGFAIPINMAMQVANELIQYGQLRRGYLGVTLDPDFTVNDLVSAGYQLPGGALVKSVQSGSPAAVAHLQRGDIIVEFGGKPVDNDDHLVAQVGLTPIGSTVPMIIYRSGKRYRTDVLLKDLN